MDFLEKLDRPVHGAEDMRRLIHDLDQCFLAGFARLDQTHRASLGSLTRVFTDTPLQKPLQEGWEAIQRNEFRERHFATIASARAALQGTYFEILQTHVTAALARTSDELPELPDIPDMEIPSHIRTWLESTRHWLMELAITGFARIEAETVLPFISTLEQIQAEPRLVRQAAVLTGLFDELLNTKTGMGGDTLSPWRWTDLWTRSMVGTFHLFPTLPGKTISGTLYLLGCDLRQHSHLVSMVLYAILETNASAKFVRLPMSSFKVDVIVGEEVWRLFPHAAPLFDAFSQKKFLHIKDMPLLPTGDLIWNGKVTSGKAYKPMEQASQWFAQDSKNRAQPCQFHPSDRHPVQLAEPVFLDNYVVRKDADRLWLDWGEERRLPVAMERVSLFSELTPEIVAKSVRMFGLLRFDAGQWAVQPLGVAYEKGRGKTLKKLELFTGQGAAAVIKKASGNTTVAMLKERASRLLRG